jgi:DNA-binding transcriptional ArsR family regulator
VARQSRTARRTGAVIDLTARDEALLRALGRFRVARTSQLAALFFAGVRRDTAAERLRRLYDAGLLDVRSAERSEENLYSLGPKGREWLKERGIATGAMPRGGLKHHLGIVEAWVELAGAAHASQSFSLELFRPDWEIREHLEGRDARLVPDALVQLGPGDGGLGGLRFALEVDRGTERPPELRIKVQLYEALRTGPGGIYGWRELGLVVAIDGAGKRRQEAVEEILQQEWGSWWLLWNEGQPASGLLEDFDRLPSRGPLAARGGMPR